MHSRVNRADAKPRVLNANVERSARPNVGAIVSQV